MTTWLHPQCGVCRHRHPPGDGLRRTPTCGAFPDGIPDAVARLGHDHRLPFPGDRGVRFGPTSHEAAAAAAKEMEAQGLDGTDLSARAPVVRTPRQRWFVFDGRPATCAPYLSGGGQDHPPTPPVRVTWILDPDALVVVDGAAGAEARILEYGVGCQAPELAGWLIAEALHGALGSLPSAVSVRDTASPGRRRPAALLADVAEDLDCDLVDLRPEADPQGVAWIKGTISPWPASLCRS